MKKVYFKLVLLLFTAALMSGCNNFLWMSNSDTITGNTFNPPDNPIISDNPFFLESNVHIVAAPQDNLLTVFGGAGAVINKESGAPLAGVLVEIENLNKEPGIPPEQFVKNYLTNELGGFNLNSNGPAEVDSIRGTLEDTVEIRVMGIALQRSPVIAIAIAIPTLLETYTTTISEQVIAGTCSADVINLQSSQGAFSSQDCAVSGTWAMNQLTLAEGDTVIVVSANFSDGTVLQDSITITYQPNPPAAIAVTSPSAQPTFITTSAVQVIAGTCSSNAVNLQTSFGSFAVLDCAGSGTWSLNPITFPAGDTMITISAENEESVVAQDSITITYQPNPPAVIAVTSPSAQPTFFTTNAVQVIAGTCSSNAMNLQTSFGSFAVQDCAGSGTWSLNPIILSPGDTVITISAENEESIVTQASITIAYEPAVVRVSQTESSSSVISGQGDFVLFVSQAESRFLRLNDIAGATSSIAVNSVITPGINTRDGHLGISADGRFVMFVTDENVSALENGTDSNGTSDLFVKDIQTGRKWIVSRGLSGLAAGITTAYVADSIERTSIDNSANGDRFVFVSASNNLDPGDTNGWDDIFQFDRSIGLITRLSTGSPTANPNTSSPSLSCDGSVVAFTSRYDYVNDTVVDNNYQVYLKEIATGTYHIVSSPNGASQRMLQSSWRGVASNNRKVAYISQPPVGQPQLYLRNIDTLETTLLSKDTLGNPANGRIYEADISCDGKYVSFLTAATNLVSGLTYPAGSQQVFVVDTDTGGIAILSKDISGQPSGPAGAWDTYHPRISDDGRYITFTTSHKDLVAGDSDSLSDVFRVRNPLIP